jgi:alpha-D-xyloside xylohydrolase
LREVWNIAPENHPAYKSIVYYNKLRYKLMPYIYSLAGSAYHNDYTLMRGLVMDYANDNVAMNVSDQFMLGPSLMICPVYEYKARSREVYLPKGKKWYNFNDEAEVIEGGKRIVADAPYELMPIYIPSGAIIAYGPEIEYVDQIPATEITLKVYAGNDGSFTLYEDDGESFDYENGKYSIIPISYNDTTKSLTISERRGEYDGMLKERVFVINYNDNGTIKTTRVDYSGKELTVAL